MQLVGFRRAGVWQAVPSIALARVAHLLAYVHVLRGIGVPVERELRRARLPTLLAEMPDAYIAVGPALGFLQAVARSEGIDDLGGLVVGREALSRLTGDVRAALRSAPTLYARLQRFGASVARENTSLRLSMIPESLQTRLCLSLRGLPPLAGSEYSEWLQIDTLVDIVRDAAGPRWHPSEITFRSQFPLSADTFERFPNTRFRLGCSETSIAVPSALLGELLRREPSDPDGDTPTCEPTEVASTVPSPDFPASLKLALRPYLAEGGPDVDVAADLVGTSTRTLQRRLLEHGLSYRSLLRDLRVEAAAEMLASSSATVLDVACAVGYNDPSNFARAFRQVTGASPTGVRS